MSAGRDAEGGVGMLADLKLGDGTVADTDGEAPAVLGDGDGSGGFAGVGIEGTEGEAGSRGSGLEEDCRRWWG